MANSADTDKMRHYTAIHLDTQCLQKYPFRSSYCLYSLNQQSGFASYFALPFIKPNITKIFQTLMSKRTEYIHSLPATVVLSVANLCKQMLGLIWIHTGTDRISERYFEEKELFKNYWQITKKQRKSENAKQTKNAKKKEKNIFRWQSFNLNIHKKQTRMKMLSAANLKWHLEGKEILFHRIMPRQLPRK